jgi:predicted  nucleic acid-binding Zn-ribbon protein
MGKKMTKPIQTKCMICGTIYSGEKLTNCDRCNGDVFEYRFPEATKQIDWEKVKEKAETKTGDFSRIIEALKEYDHQVRE